MFGPLKINVYFISQRVFGKTGEKRMAVWWEKGQGTQIPVARSDLGCPNPPGFLFSLPVGLPQINLSARRLPGGLALLLESKERKSSLEGAGENALQSIKVPHVNL